MPPGLAIGGFTADITVVLIIGLLWLIMAGFGEAAAPGCSPMPGAGETAGDVPEDSITGDCASHCFCGGVDRGTPLNCGSELCRRYDASRYETNLRKTDGMMLVRQCTYVRTTLFERPSMKRRMALAACGLGVGTTL